MFVNVFNVVDWYEAKLGRWAVPVGLELEGDLPIKKKSRILFSTGYGFIVGGGYNIAGEEKLVAWTFDNWIATASLGFVWDVSNKTSLYLKAIGRCCNITNSLHSIETGVFAYSDARSFTAMLEVGFKGNTGHDERPKEVIHYHYDDGRYDRHDRYDREHIIFRDSRPWWSAFIF